MTQLPGTAINYDECEREPIATPGAIQSYGGLVVVRRGEVVACSENIGLFLPLAPKDLLQRKIAEASPELSQLIRNCPPDLPPAQTAQPAQSALHQAARGQRGFVVRTVRPAMLNSFPAKRRRSMS